MIPFAIIFPGFFVYHVLLSQGLSPVLGGYFGISIIVCLPILIWKYVRGLVRQNRISVLEVFFWFFLAYCALWVQLFRASAAFPETIDNIQKSLILAASFFMFGQTIEFRAQSAKRFVLISFCSMVAIFFYFSPGGYFILGAGTEASATYQFFGMLFVFVATMAFLSTRTARGRILVVLFSAASLILNGSRADLFVALGMLCIFVVRSASGVAVILTLALGGAVLIAYLPTIVDLLADSGIPTVTQNRFFDLLANYATSARESRSELSSAAEDTIIRSPFAGGLASYSPGDYAHNILSAWVDFGIVGFISLILILLGPLFLVSRIPLARDDARIWFGYFVSNVAMLLVVKSYQYPAVFVGLGLMVQYLRPGRPVASLAGGRDHCQERPSVESG